MRWSARPGRIVDPHAATLSPSRVRRTGENQFCFGPRVSAVALHARCDAACFAESGIRIQSRVSRTEEVTMKDPAVAVREEMDRFIEVLPQLLLQIPGKWVVFREAKVQSVHEDEDSAFSAGHR